MQLGVEGFFIGQAVHGRDRLAAAALVGHCWYCQWSLGTWHDRAQRVDSSEDQSFLCGVS
jgi:hypothetical protein